MTDFCINFANIQAATQRIREQAVYTPIITNARLDERVGKQVFIKPECLQMTGSFKFRGAYNRLSQIAPEDRHKGVVAWSSGNHAQGVAAAAAILGIPCTIVMPSDAPAIKMANTKALGATVRPYDRATESREEIATAMSRDMGAVLVPSYDDPDIIAGQGTAGIEIYDQCKAMGVELDELICCVGGGGLIAGISTALKHLSPQTRIYGAEPLEFNDTARSLETGERVSNPSDAKSICDALLAPTPGDLTFPINQRNLEKGFSVSDDAVRAAMRFAFLELKLVAEPGGAVALASLLEYASELPGETVGVVISGGNVDPQLYAEILASK
ncbi:MAG: threonine ammonia-lyase [Sphingorhabdus sp.]